MDKIIQIIPAPANLKAIFSKPANGKQIQTNVNVVCLALVDRGGTTEIVPAVLDDPGECADISLVTEAVCYGDFVTLKYF